MPVLMLVSSISLLRTGFGKEQAAGSKTKSHDLFLEFPAVCSPLDLYTAKVTKATGHFGIFTYCAYFLGAA